MGKIVFLTSTAENGMQTVHLNKDTFYVPYYLGKRFNRDAEIVYYLPPGEKPLPEFHKGVRLRPLAGSDFSDFGVLCENYVKERAKEIDVLMMFHFARGNFRLAKLYKKRNGKGVCYIKLDFHFVGYNGTHNGSGSFLKTIAKKILGGFILGGVDVFSVETRATYEFIKRRGIMRGYNIRRKLVLTPNGIDDEMLSAPKRTPTDKENLIITVGRIGTPPKNSEMFLDALYKTDLKNWRVCFIGPVTDEFEASFQQFKRQKPESAEKVKLIGDVSDRRKLFDWYDRAKVFVLTSRFESFGLVLTEALCFNDYIISTDVGAAADITENFTLGGGITDSDALADKLRGIIGGGGELTPALYERLAVRREQFYWDNVIKPLADKIAEKLKR